MAAAAKLLIDIAADIAKLRSDFNEAGKVLGDFGKGVEKIGGVIKSALGTAGLGLSIEGVRQFIDSVADIGEAADKVQLSTDSFQALTAALRDAGVSAENTSSLLSRANQTLGKAFDGNKESVELMQRLKVGLIDLQGNAASFEQTLPRVARAILNIENPMQRASAAAAFFGGKVGKEAIPALQEMAKGTEALKAQYASEIVPEETIRRFDQLSDSLKGLAKESVVKFAEILDKTFTPELVQNIKEIATDLGKAAGSLNDFLKGQGLGDPNATIKSSQQEWAFLARLIDAAKGALIDYGVAAGRLPAPMFGPDFPAWMQSAGAPDKSGTQYGPGTVTTPPRPDPFSRFPRITGGSGVDKFTEAMTRLRAETEATQLALDKFNEAMASGLPQKEAERQAKLLADIGIKQAQMIKGVADVGEQGKIKAAVEALEQLKAKLEETKATQQLANEVNAKYGDGQKVLADRMFELNRAYDAGKISIEEYNAAVKDANDAAERQALIHEGLKEGIEGVGAGFQFAALSMTQAQTDFQLGQDLFQAGFQTLSGAISEFVDKGTIDFNRLAKAFAAMLIEMAVRWAAMSFLRSAVGGLGNLFGGGGSFGYGPGLPGGSMTFGGPRAEGGRVSPGHWYMVGERGPEPFIPDTAGTIVPNGGGGGITVNINNYANAKVTATQRRGPGGGMNVDVLVEMIESRMGGRMQRGQGALVGAMEGTYRLTPQGR